MSRAKPVMGQTQGDGCPVQQICSDLKRATYSNKFHADRNPAACDSSSRKKSNATSLKMLLAKEMTKEVESKRKPPNVVARLMGLEMDLTARGPVLHQAKGDFWKSQSSDMDLKQQQQQHFVKSTTQDIHPFYQEAVGYNDVYEVSEAQARMSYFQDKIPQKGGSSGNTSDRMDILRGNFMETKCFGMAEKTLYSKDLQEALRVVSSNKDLFLKFLEEPNSIVSRQLIGSHTNLVPPQKKRITVLKPLGSVEGDGIRQHGTKEQNGAAMRELHQSSNFKEENPSPPSRIVLLRPTPGKPSLTKSKLTPRTTPFLPIDPSDFMGVLDDNGATLGSKNVAPCIIHNQKDNYHQQDDSLLSSSYSNGYGGDESSLGDSEIDQNNDSDIDYIEDNGGTFSDPEGRSPVSKCTKGHENPYPGSPLSKISHFPESSVTKEAKQWLSQRWATVTCDETSQEQERLPRSTCTLGEMLSLQEVKNDDFINGVPSSSTSQSCGTESELLTQAKYVTACRKDERNGDTPVRLPRSTSVPLIPSTLNNMVANVKALNHQDHERTKRVLVPNKEKISFRGRVSDFFFPRGKRTTRQISANHTSDWSSGKTEACGGDSQPDASRDLDGNEKTAICEDTLDICAVQISTSTSEGTTNLADVPTPLDCLSGNQNRLGLEVLNSTRDQPSPTSVLDAPSEDSSCNEPESSASTIPKNAKAASRSSAIEAVACSLSWDTTSESTLPGTRGQSSFLPDVDDDESECHVLVQNIMSSAGLDDAESSMPFTGWHLPDCPLDPVLFNKVLELREQSSYQRLLFDCVNVALIEIGENTLLSTFPWSKAHCRTWGDASSPALGIEVWSILKDWIYGARMFVVNKRDNAGIMMDRIVKQEVEGTGWVKIMRTQLVDITEQIEGGVWEELMGEAVLDFVCVCQQ